MALACQVTNGVFSTDDLYVGVVDVDESALVSRTFQLERPDVDFSKAVLEGDHADAIEVRVNDLDFEVNVKPDVEMRPGLHKVSFRLPKSPDSPGQRRPETKGTGVSISWMVLP